MMRVGFGYDVHALAEGRKLVLGGVTIPFARGLAGHSDADVLLHAICDAMLGAAALGDIGDLFPDTDARFKNIASTLLLEEVVRTISEKGWQVGNLDSTVVAQEPKIKPYIPRMQAVLSAVLHVPAGCVSIKATTEEHLGFTGTGRGIKAYAVVLLIKQNTLS